MTNGEFVDDKKIKDILTYIKSMKHAEQIRMMFLFSLNGLRAINFTFLQVKDCYTDQLKPNDVINLDSNKNKGKHSCSYFMNSQMKKELGSYSSKGKSSAECEVTLSFSTNPDMSAVEDVMTALMNSLER